MAKEYKVAVVGATGLVGSEMLRVLDERGFPASEIVPLASTRSAGQRIEWRGKGYTVGIAKEGAFAGVDVALMSAGSGPSQSLAPMAAAAGAVVIDNSSCWRMDPEVPLVVPEVNPQAIAGFTTRRIIANPNCSTIQMVVALAPLHRKAHVKRVVVSTYQAVSGAGKAAMDELGSQVSALFSQRDLEQEVFPRRIAFNCIPQIDAFADGDYTKEELKMANETRKILGDPDIGVCATCVRVPVFNGHAESVVVEFEQPLAPQEARELLREAPGVLLTDWDNETGSGGAPDKFPTQVEAEGTDATHVGRIRADDSAPNSLALWCVADNLRKGAATNAVQIAEILIRDYL